jgi:hypothetical protein
MDGVRIWVTVERADAEDDSDDRKHNPTITTSTSSLLHLLPVDILLQYLFSLSSPFSRL